MTIPRYQVAFVLKPPGWQPAGFDAAPPQSGKPVEFLEAVDDLFCAVGQAMDYNERSAGAGGPRWAVVVEPEAAGWVWPGARLCTPLRYQVNPIWWPEGWEPTGPLDVPNCVWQAPGRPAETPLGYPKAEATAAALNRQCLDAPATVWHVVMAVENEPLSRTVSYDAAGTEATVEVRRMHVIRPGRGGTGDCSHCPAHAFPCAKAHWHTLMQTATARSTRPRTA